MSRRPQALAHGAGEPNPLRWHVGITNPGYERHVRDAMQARGIDTVMPLIRYWRIRNRQRGVAERPLLARCVIFGMDHDTQSLVDRGVIHERIGDGWDQRLVPTERRGDSKSIVGLERVVTNGNGGWADIPPREVYDLRFAILRGEFDATLRQWSRERSLPDLIRRLIAAGELSIEAGLTHKEAKRSGLKFSVAA